MSHLLLKNTQDFIAKEQLFTTASPLIVAVSGGLDSVVLLHVLQALNYPLRVAHFNYHLRGEESEEDATFVRRLSNKLGLPFDYRSSNADENRALKSGNLQAVARKLRYDWLADLQQVHGIEQFCTAHHLEDNLETFLLQFSRGTSLTGLTGMQPKLENGLCRPFLATPRKMIEDYARCHQLIWREDRSNATDDYLRNQIRHHILPSFLTLQSDAHQRVSSTFERLRSEEKLFLAGLDKLWQVAQVSDHTIDRRLLPQDQDMALRLLHHKLRPYGFLGDQFRQMLTAKSGTTIQGSKAQVKIRKELLYLSYT